MNSHCSVCNIEKECGYEYKPCDCCNYRKFKPKPADHPLAQAIQFPQSSAVACPTDKEK